MALELLRPLGAPDWFTFFVEPLQALLGRVDRQNIKFLRRDFDKSNAGQTISLGSIPANAIVVKPLSGFYVHEAFNAGTNNRANIGTAASATLYGSGLSLLTQGFVPVTAGASFRPSQTGMTEMKFVVDVTGTAATTGKASAVLAYLVA